jgi:hypothetical protein
MKKMNEIERSNFLTIFIKILGIKVSLEELPFMILTRPKWFVFNLERGRNKCRYFLFFAYNDQNKKKMESNISKPIDLKAQRKCLS